MEVFIGGQKCIKVVNADGLDMNVVFVSESGNLLLVYGKVDNIISWAPGQNQLCDKIGKNDILIYSYKFVNALLVSYSIMYRNNKEIIENCKKSVDFTETTR